MYGVLKLCLFALVCIQIELQRNFKLCVYFFSKFELPNHGCSLYTELYGISKLVYCDLTNKLSHDLNLVETKNVNIHVLAKSTYSGYDCTATAKAFICFTVLTLT